MKAKYENGQDPIDFIRKLALQYPETEEGIACEGTALESLTFKAWNKAFLFVRHTDGICQMRLKLSKSQTEAAKLGALQPNIYKVGVHGWIAIRFGDGELPPTELLSRWIKESYHAIAGKRAEAALTKQI